MSEPNPHKNEWGGDVPCADCGTDKNPVWHVSDELWNRTIRTESYTTDPILCVPCFLVRSKGATTSTGIDYEAMEDVIREMTTFLIESVIDAVENGTEKMWNQSAVLWRIKLLEAALEGMGAVYRIDVDALGAVTDPFSGNPLYPLAAEMLSNFEKHGALVQVWPKDEL